MHSKNEFFKGLTRIITDIFSVILSWSLAYYIRPWTDLIPHIKFHFPLERLPSLEFFIPFTFYSSAGLFIIFFSLGLYSYPAKYFSFSSVKNVLWGVFLWVLSIVAIYSLVLHDLIFSRIMLIHAGLFTIVFSLFFRFLLHLLFTKIFYTKKNALVFGNTSDALYIKKSLQNSQFEIQSIFDYSEKLSDEKLQNISDIFFFENSDTQKKLQRIREISAEKGKVLHVIPEYALNFWGHAQLEIIRDIPMIVSSPVAQNYWFFAIKRIFDIIISFLLLILFSPLFLCVAIAIQINSSGPIFYLSQRVGRNGKLFTIYKFRSMKVNAEKEKEKLLEKSHRDGPLFKIQNDPRVTSVGKFLRKTSIDELPQLLNVLQGTMSLIGPRPHLAEEVSKYGKAERRILSVRPGISGLAQVSGRSDLSFEREIFLDIFYCENMSVMLDLKIFIKTPFILAFGKGAD